MLNKVSSPPLHYVILSVVEGSLKMDEVRWMMENHNQFAIFNDQYRPFYELY
jgi:hypothetical protein